ncbi:MAG: tyrosine--tRNA ligase [Sphingobacteriales bacterium JAD_PAG50586_3]|nr:MAG: tyrosine--tRNA ligase [Sphingobacteriales bacterium JAD_PAG50586_3]
MTLIEELRQRGMIHDTIPGTEELLENGSTGAYIGFDPTAASLHIGSLVQIMLLMHLQKRGHKAYALVGGATGMIGDPSGKSEERKFLSTEDIQVNVDGIKGQLAKFLDFEGDNAAEIVNNADWFGKMGFLEFLRDAGKLLTVNYMMAKDSVQKRLETGISFTEFSYQLVQGYDFYYLYHNKGVKIQAGGSDQWGNIVTGTEFIRRKVGGEAYAFTCPLITKADGSKFGKSEQGNVWLDANLTSPYHFYQFWLNVADADAMRYIKIFTFIPLEEIAEMERQHTEAPHLRILQKRLAEDITVRVHSREDYDQAVEASEILFGKGTTESLARLPENVFTSVFEGVPQFTVAKADLEAGINVLDLLAVNTTIFPSKGEARKMLVGGGVGINKIKLEDAEATINATQLLNNRYLLVQKGKKNYFLIIVN